MKVSQETRIFNLRLYYADGSVRFPCPIYNVDSDRRYGGHILNADRKDKILRTDPYVYE